MGVADFEELEVIPVDVDQDEPFSRVLIFVKSAYINNLPRNWLVEDYFADTIRIHTRCSHTYNYDTHCYPYTGLHGTVVYTELSFKPSI
jgi:hypothetical protein